MYSTRDQILSSLVPRSLAHQMEKTIMLALRVWNSPHRISPFMIILLEFTDSPLIIVIDLPFFLQKLISAERQPPTLSLQPRHSVLSRLLILLKEDSATVIWLFGVIQRQLLWVHIYPGISLDAKVL